MEPTSKTDSRIDGILKNCGSLGIAGKATISCDLGASLKLWQAEVEPTFSCEVVTDAADD